MEKVKLRLLNTTKNVKKVVGRYEMYLETTVIKSGNNDHHFNK